ENNPSGKQVPLHGECSPTMRDGGFAPAQFSQQCSETHVSYRVIRLQGDGLTIAFNGLLSLARSAERVAQIEVRLGAAGKGRKGLAYQLYAALRMPALGFDKAQQV